MSTYEPFFLLLAYTLVREVFFFFQMSKLLNKAMSRSYFEYKQAENLGKPEEVRVENPWMDAPIEAVGGMGEF